jgi:hypothetical protein
MKKLNLLALLLICSTSFVSTAKAGVRLVECNKQQLLQIANDTIEREGNNLARLAKRAFSEGDMDSQACFNQAMAMRNSLLNGTFDIKNCAMEKSGNEVYSYYRWVVVARDSRTQRIAGVINRNACLYSNARY